LSLVASDTLGDFTICLYKTKVNPKHKVITKFGLELISEAKTVQKYI